MKIRHKETGEVVDTAGKWAIGGVEHWRDEVNHRRYFYADGWREVPEEEWVDVTHEFSAHLNQIIVPSGYQMRAIEAIVFPNSWDSTLVRSGLGSDALQWIYQFKRTVLVVEKLQEADGAGPEGAGG